MTGRAVVVASIALLRGCGGDGDSRLDAVAEVPLLRAPSAYASASCERVFGCCSVGELTELFPSAQPPVTDNTMRARVLRLMILPPECPPARTPLSDGGPHLEASQTRDPREARRLELERKVHARRTTRARTPPTGTAVSLTGGLGER